MWVCLLLPVYMLSSQSAWLRKSKGLIIGLFVGVHTHTHTHTLRDGTLPKEEL